MEEKESKAQEGASTESVTTKIEPDSKRDTWKDSKVEKVVEWDKDEQLLILETIIEEGAEYNTPIKLACELFNEFIQRPRRHSPFWTIGLNSMKKRSLKHREECQLNQLPPRMS
jgi:hypothetical protein